MAARANGSSLRSLDGITGGVFLVVTETSWHLLDLDQRTTIRLPTGRDDLTPARLRCDSWSLYLIGARVWVGHPMVLLVDLGLRGGKVTIRRSTTVLQIQELDSDP